MERYEEYKEDRLGRLSSLPKKLEKIAKKILEDLFRDNYIYTYVIESVLKENAMTDYFGKDEKDIRILIEFLFSKEQVGFFDYIKENGNLFAYTSGYYRRSYRDLSVNDKAGQIFQTLSNLLNSMYRQEKLGNLAVDIPKTEDEYYYIVSNASLYTAYLIDSKDGKIIELIKNIILSEKNTQSVSYELIRAVIYSKNQELVELLGKLLVAAQRQEGLRQSIVENADCGRVENFIYFIKLIIDNDLFRFNSVIRSISVWANMTNIDTLRPKLVEKIIKTMYESLVDEKAREDYLESEDKTEVYLSLWAEATHDVSRINDKIRPIIKENIDYKLVTLTSFLNTITREKVNDEILYEILKVTENYQVIAWVSIILQLHFNYSISYVISKKLEPLELLPEDNKPLSKKLLKEIFEKYKTLHRNIKGKKGSIEIIDSGIEGSLITIYKENVEEGIFIAATELKDDRKIDELMAFATSSKVKKAYLNNFVYKLRDERDRKFLIESLGNSRESSIQKQAKVFLDLLKLEFTDEELIFIEDMLRLKSPDSRNIALEYLGNQKPENLCKSIERLIGNSKLENRLGGLDLAVNKIDSKDKKIYRQVEELLENHQVKSPAEQVLIDKFLGGDKREDLYTLDNGLGFLSDVEDIVLPDLDNKSKFNLKKDLFTLSYKDFKKYADKLNKLFDDNREESFKVTYYDGTSNDFILGAYPGIVKPLVVNGEKLNHVKIDELDNLYLSEIWREFFRENEIPIEFIYELNYLSEFGYLWASMDGVILNKMLKMSDRQLELDTEYDDYTKILVHLFPVKDLVEKVNLFRVDDYNNKYYYRANWVKLNLLNDVLKEYVKTKENREESKIFQVAKNALHKLYLEIPDVYYSKEISYSWNKDEKFTKNFVGSMGTIKHLRFIMMDNIKDDRGRLKDYLSLMNAYFNKSMRINGDLYAQFSGEFINAQDVARGYEEGVISANYFYKFALRSNLIKEYTREQLYYRESELFKDKYPRGLELVDNLVNRMVDIEIDRGDSPTRVSKLVAGNVENYKGADYFVRLLSRLDYKETFARNIDNYWGIDFESRKSMISGLIKRNAPRDGEGVDEFRILLKDKNLPDELLVDVAMYNNKWTDIICDYLGWEGLRSSIWYFRAHTGEFQNGDEKEINAKEISRYSPVSLDEFEEGVFDIEWFKDVYKQLGKKRFEVVYNSAKYISSNAKHKRAQTYSDAALGKLKITDIEKSIKEKRNQLNVRAYGVIPIKKNRDKDILSRYNRLQLFLKESKKFGAQRQASEKKSFEISMENLAKNAGYSDVTTLSLVLESQISDELLKYFDYVEIDNYQLKLVNEKLGSYKILIKNGDKELKSVPSKIKKDKSYKEIDLALKTVRDQYSRSVKSFENMMNREIEISAENIMDIMRSKIFYPIFENLIFMKDDKFGYIKDDKLVDPDGNQVQLKEGEKLRVAHPYDLYKNKIWNIYQKDIFKREAVQPFKQVFRELYLPNEDERERGDSLRYAGHQLQGNKLFGLMKTRGWISGGESIYYNYKIYAKLYGIADYFSPSDIGEPVLELIRFFDIKTDELVPIAQVPPIMFSEIMRDVDLFVSVAYVGGVDPEASLSTIEMRGVIVKELLNIMKVKNVSIEDRFVKVTGVYGNYNIHLGSGSIQMTGKGSINILAVHSDSRGKLFLPFVDEDPKTAEIVSKILLLSKDDEIKDPTIVNQIK